MAALIDADLLILLSDIDGLYTDDPRQNPDAEFIEQVDELTDEFMNMGKASTGSNVGTGGMNTKMIAAKIATSSDVDMIIANSRDIGVLHRLLEGENEGTLFVAHREESFDLPEFVQNLHKIDPAKGEYIMNMDERIKRINELYHKSQNEGLTDEEKLEQTILRQEYVDSIKRNMKAQLDNIEIERPDGTIEKLSRLIKEK